MDNLAIAVIAIAVAQALTILLSIGREREIRKLRELVNEQRLHIVKLSAWLAGRNAAQPSQIKSEREPIREPIAHNMKAPEPATTPKELPETIRPRTAEDEAAQAMKALNWSREIVAGLQAGLKGRAPPEPAITRVPAPMITPKDLPDTIRPGTTEDELKRATKTFKWFKEDADEPREIAEAREIIAGLKGGAPPEPAITRVPEPVITPKDLPDTIRPSITEDELKRATKAINWLKEDVAKARAIVAAQQVNQIGPVMPLEIHTAEEAKDEPKRLALVKPVADERAGDKSPEERAHERRRLEALSGLIPATAKPS